uniref:Rieske (2Fe-2S) protein n=1 Tax=Marinobacterium profundum TaxID=1714300 RepID=UPI000829C4D3|nr:Rieske (2Fe-2S) protein [Marinobacterium profundum]
MTVLCNTSEIPAQSARGFSLDGRALVAVHHNDRFFVYENRCPHRGVELEWQPDQFFDFEGNYIQCSTHGALFKIDTGECIAGPCNGKALTQVAFSQIDGQIVLL